MKKKPTIVCELTPEELSIVFTEIHAQVYITNLRKKYTYEQVGDELKKEVTN